jgi:hypothetical protein
MTRRTTDTDDDRRVLICLILPHLGGRDEEFCSPGPLFGCLTPAVMPSLHTARLRGFHIDSAACRKQVTAAMREGALVRVKVKEWPQGD